MLKMIPLNKCFFYALAMCFVFAAANAQAQDHPLDRFAPDKCNLFLQWHGLPDVNPDGNSTEKWLAQEEIQAMFQKLQRAIEDAIEQQGGADSEIAELLLEKYPELAKHQLAMYLNFNSFENFEASASAIVAVEIRDLENLFDEFDRELGQREELTTVDREGFEILTTGDEEKVHVTRVDGVYVVGFGKISIDDFIAQIKQPAPKWLGEARKRNVVTRPFGSVYADLRDVQELQEPYGEDYPAFLHFEDLGPMSFSAGLDQFGFCVHAFVGSESKLGLASVFDVEPLTKESLKDLPDDVLAGFAGSVSIENIWKLVEAGFEASDDMDTLENGLEEIEDYTGMRFEEDLLQLFSGRISSYNRMSLTNPAGSGMAAVQVKNKTEFAKKLPELNDMLEELGSENGLQFEEKESNKHTIYSLTGGGFGMPGFSWCLTDDTLLISTDSRQISTQLRKRKRDSGKLTDDVWFQTISEADKSNGLENPVAMYYFDLTPALQIGLPLMRAFLQQQDFEYEFDFDVDDVPDAGVLTNGLKPNLATMYRTEEGFHFIERSTIPVTGFTSTGIGIGMLLPAVQQVRNAARRAQTMNNVRQLVLSNLNYESAHGRLPPAYSQDAEGQPLLSWRVHILPYLDQQELYEKFHLDEPWDSDHNKKLMLEMPPTFEHPALSLTSGHTVFLGVAGIDGTFVQPSDAATKSPQGAKIGAVRDGTSNTIAIVEVSADHSVPWTKPADFDPGEFDDFTSVLAGNWPGGYGIFAMVDGSCHLLNVDSIDEEKLRDLFNKNDGNPTTLSDWDN